MHRTLWLVSALLVVALAVPAGAADTIRRLGKAPSVAGDIQSMNKDGVTIKKIAGTETVSVGEIDFVSFDSEPVQMNIIRNHVKNGNYQLALDELAKIDPKSIGRAELRQDLEYYRALALVRIAVTTGKDPEAADKALRDFLAAYPNNYHFYAGTEALGDLALARKDFAGAATLFSSLEASASPEVKMRAGLAKGRALVAQGKHAEALTAYTSAVDLAKTSQSPVAVSIGFAANLGKAQCLAATGQYAEAIKIVDSMIDNLGPEDADLQARAYVTKGNCLRQEKGQEKAAILAYLHVDVLYPANAEAHAEALANLGELWEVVGKTERSTLAKQTLQQRYPNSPWAKQ